MKNEKDKQTGTVITGVYQHYKGPEYEVLGVCQHSETEDNLVIYRALYGEYGLWVRPLDMFTEKIQVEEGHVDRFKLIKAYPISLGNFSKGNSA